MPTISQKYHFRFLTTIYVDVNFHLGVFALYVKKIKTKDDFKQGEMRVPCIL